MGMGCSSWLQMGQAWPMRAELEAAVIEDFD